MPPVETSEAVEGVKRALSQLRNHEAELQSTIDRLTQQKTEVLSKVLLLEDELDALVNAPVSKGHDPFEWLPDELLIIILVMLPLDVLWSGVCECVCHRWERLMKSSPVNRRKGIKWAAYESWTHSPPTFKAHTMIVWSIAIGKDGTIYTGSSDRTVKVWGDNDTLLHTLADHTSAVVSLAVGLNNNVYSGSPDCSIRIWGGNGDLYARKSSVQVGFVYALAVGLDGKIYSGTSYYNVDVWSDDGTRLDTLVGHTNGVLALAIGLDGAVYSGSADKTIRVWCGHNGRHIRTLEGHTQGVFSLAVGCDGKIYSGSKDRTIMVWQGDNGALLQTLEGHNDRIEALAVGLEGTLFSASADCTLRVWQVRSGSHVLSYTIMCRCVINTLAISQNGTLYSGDDGGYVKRW